MGNPDQPGAARDRRAARAALDSVDVTRRLPGEEVSADAVLPGEDPTTAYRSDVEMWIAVYSELLEFKRFMLDGAAARAAAMTTEIARAEIEDTDLRVARAEAERFARRLAFWRARQEALAEPAAAAPDSAP